jgi:hypothetical protein
VYPVWCDDGREVMLVRDCKQMHSTLLDEAKKQTIDCNSHPYSRVPRLHTMEAASATKAPRIAETMAFLEIVIITGIMHETQGQQGEGNQ